MTASSQVDPVPEQDGRREQALELANTRWPEVERGPRRLLVVPVGSLEQHGPHLPLDTDTRIATAVARRVLGDPAGASAAEGERLLARLTLSLSDAIGRLAG